MKNLLIPIILMVTLFSCNEEKLSLSMDKEKLVDILADMHVAEEMIGKFREEDKDSVRNLIMNEITEIHQIDTSTIFSEIRLIQNNPELGLEVYGEVYTRLEKYSKTYDKSNKSKDEDKKEMDSKDNDKKENVNNDESNKSAKNSVDKKDGKINNQTDLKSDDSKKVKSDEKDK